MPSNLKQVYTQTFMGGINTTTAPELKQSNECEYILNCNSLSGSSGNVGIITNVLGNTIIPTSLPAGENIRIGYAADEETNNFYSFMWNSLGYHTIYRYNSLERTEIVILQNLTDTNNIDILRFDKNFLILHADVVENNLLYWVDGINNARKIDISKCLDKSNSGYGLVIREDYITAYKRTSSYAPKATYFSDTTKQFNRLYGRLYKFIQRFIYDNGEKSNWSDISNTPLPGNEPISGISEIPTNNNGIEVVVETGSPIVTGIEIAMQSTDSSLTDGGFLNYRLIATLDKEDLAIDDDSTYTYRFYNDGNYPVTDPEKVIRPYSYMPKRPMCQNVVKNALIYWNGWEGFDSVDLNVEVEVDYEDLFIEPGVENEWNEPLFERTAHSVAYVNGPGGDRETYETVSVGADVRKGNVFTFQFEATPPLGASWSYTASAFDTATTVANYFRNILSGYDPTTYRSPISIDGSGTASFSYTIRATIYVEGRMSVTPIQFNSLKDTGESVPNIKLGSSIKLGITYEDEDGRKSLAYTVDALIVNISTINELEGFKKPVITLDIKHRPPAWARFYQIVRSPDLVYGQYTQMLIQEALEVEAISGQPQYLDLVVGSLFTYQKIHPNTVIKYNFTPGDRIRLISWTDPDTLVKTYYDFYETEILSYNPTITVEKNETVSATDGSDVITIGGVTSADNIGKVIIIDGAERTIIAAPSGNTYQLSNPMIETKKFLSYTLIDRRGTLRIRKPLTDIIPEVKNVSIVELYTPSSDVNTADVKTFNEFGIKLPILNYGTETRSHAGMSQDQDGTSAVSLVTTPATLIIDSGTAYVRNREFPLTNDVPGADVIIDSIEDSGYSDYYNSNFNDNGRLTVEDTGDGEVHFGSRARFSNNYIQDTRINGLNDFDNLDREDYNDAYGDILRTYFSENRVFVFKPLKDTWVPVLRTIFNDDTGAQVVGTSSKLLNNMQYFAYDGGVGNNPESLAVNASWIYHVMPNAGVFVRLGGNGVIPISEIYQLDNKVKEYLRDANKYGARIYGGFDRFNGLSVTAISNYNKSIFKAPFSQVQWQLYDAQVTATYELVQDATHGDVAFTNPTQWTYTPDTDYVGSDFFTYRAFIDGAWSDPKKICFTITPSTITATAWRPKESSSFCVLNGLGNKTGYKGWTELEEYVLGLNSLTGNVKENLTTDANYAAPVYDLTTCELNDLIVDQFYFTDITDANLSTEYISNPVEVEGINGTVIVSSSGVGQYSKNGGAYTSDDGTAVLGDVFTVKQTSSASLATAVNTTLDIGGTSDTYTVTTKSYQLTIDNTSNQAPNVEVVDDTNSASLYSALSPANTTIGPVNITPIIDSGTYTVIVSGVNLTSENITLTADGVSHPVDVVSGTDYYFNLIPKEATSLSIVLSQTLTLPDFDYLKITYEWLPAAGADLDTFTGLINTGTVYDNDWVGFSQGDAKVPAGAATPYVWWAGDNTAGGKETVLIDFQKFILDNSSTPNPVEIRMNAVWFSGMLTGDISVAITTYKGGTMSLDAPNFDFINTGGVVVTNTSVPVNIALSSNSGNIANSQDVAIVEYDKTTLAAQLILL